MSDKKERVSGMARREVIVPIGPSIAYVPLTQGQFALIDSDDAAEIGKYNWHAQWKPTTQSFYARRRILRSNGKWSLLGMHREIMKCPEDMDVDHIFGRTLDNRSSQLRLATRAENCRNRRISSDNTSGFKGVSWHKKSRRWRARININGSDKYLGYYKTPEEAHDAYCVASEKYFGEFRRVA